MCAKVFAMCLFPFDVVARDVVPRAGVASKPAEMFVRIHRVEDKIFARIGLACHIAPDIFSTDSRCGGDGKPRVSLASHVNGTAHLGSGDTTKVDAGKSQPAHPFGKPFNGTIGLRFAFVGTVFLHLAVLSF